MGEAVPVRRVLGVEHDGLVRADVGIARIGFFHRQVEVEQAVPHDRMEYGRLAKRVEHAASRSIQRVAEAEDTAGLYLLQRPQPALVRQEVHPAALVFVSEFSPVRPFRALLPTSGHPLQPPQERGL